ncbi:MAG: MarR family winged helix-turn-helix transcriptional regulator [Acidimicrobiales bacterium]
MRRPPPRHTHGGVVARLGRQLERALADTELSLPQYRLLLHLAGGSSAQANLAAKLAVSPPSVTAVVDGLVSRGFVARRPDDADRRRVVHVLTAKGRKALRDAETATEARLTEIVALLDDPAEVKRAMEGLELWERALEAWRAAKPKPPVPHPASPRTRLRT